MNPEGPRLIFKDDRDSSIGRGCELYGWHFRPDVAPIFQAAAASAPVGAAIVRFTEGHRPPKRADDDHTDFRALDITVEMADGSRAEKALLDVMAWRMKLFLGPDYGYLVHGEGGSLHIHFRFKRKG